MTLYDIYNHMPKEELNKLIEYRYWKHYHVKRQQYEEATKFRSLEKDIDIKWNDSKDGSKLTQNLIKIYGDNLDQENLIEVLRDMKITDLED